MYKTLGFKWLFEVFCPAIAFATADREDTRNPQRFIHVPLCLILKKTTVQQINDRKMTEIKAFASAKSKEVQTNAQADTQLHHICFCPNRTSTTFTL